jgi:hypothetical protein
MDGLVVDFTPRHSRLFITPATRRRPGAKSKGLHFVCTPVSYLPPIPLEWEKLVGVDLLE